MGATAVTVSFHDLTETLTMPDGTELTVRSITATRGLAVGSVDVPLHASDAEMELARSLAVAVLEKYEETAQ